MRKGIFRILVFAVCLRLSHARLLLFWAVDSSKRTQDMVKQNVRHVEDAGIPHDVILAHYRGSQNDWDHTWYQEHVSESLVDKGYKFRLMQKAYKAVRLWEGRKLRLYLEHLKQGLSFRLLAWRAFGQDGLWEKRYEFIWALDSDIDLSKAGRDIKQNADLPHFLEMARLSRSPIVGPTFVQADGKPLVPLLLQEHSAVVRREGHAPSRGSRRHAQQISGPNVIQSPDLGCDFRHTDFVELTAPLLKSEVLQLVLRDCRSCIQDKSDWGLDMMWCKYASKRLKNQACALIDSAPVVHLDAQLQLTDQSAEPCGAICMRRLCAPETRIKPELLP
ncbi:ACP5 [Symbiodinium sp. CCMP2592]|nr:ACP5 [Symbiodinium sp. CCMP2592]